MQSPPEINVTAASQGIEETLSAYLSPTNLSRKRSPSVTPSERSRITLVEEDVEVTSSVTAEKPAVISEIKRGSPKFHWFINRFLGVFGIEIHRRRKMEVFEENLAELEPEASNSPWILPVFVLSYQVVQKHHEPKVAKCTIDTGNHHGNIVSREFLVNVLGYPEDEFQRLTYEESKGGVSVTESTFIPLGAVYLDWYHGKSTRVFRNMRFLVSPYSFCDLIIGARSIEKNNILGVPILMAEAENLNFFKNKQSALDKELLPSIKKLGNSITTMKKSEKTSRNAQRAKEIESEEKRLKVLKAEYYLKKADLEVKSAEAILKSAKKDKKGEAQENLNKKQTDLEEKKTELQEALDIQHEDPSMVILPSSSTTKTTGTDVSRGGRR